MTYIQEHIATVNAVFIVANGSVPRSTVGTDYALFAFLPKTLANNAVLLFTNILTYFAFNFCEHTLPKILRDAPRFLFNNPIALQKNFLKLKNGPIRKKAQTELRETVRHMEQKGLGMLVYLFDWLDGREPQPTTEIVALYETSQAIETKIPNTIAQMDQVVAIIAEVNNLVKAVQTNSVSPLLYSHLAFLCMSNVGT